MDIIYHEKVASTDLPADATADTYVSFIEVKDVSSHAEKLVVEISNTSMSLT